MEITVNNIRPSMFVNNPRLQALADVQVNGILIKNFRVLLDDNGHFSVAYPQHESPGPDGKGKY